VAAAVVQDDDAPGVRLEPAEQRVGEGEGAERVPRPDRPQHGRVPALARGGEHGAGEEAVPGPEPQAGRGGGGGGGRGGSCRTGGVGDERGDARELVPQLGGREAEGGAVVPGFVGCVGVWGEGGGFGWGS